jgi:hypothetical protein
MKSGRRVKRLTAIKLHEISVVDNGAGGDHRPQSRPAIVLMKRQKPRYVMGPAFNLIPADDDTDTVDKVDTSLDRALQEIEETRQLQKSLAVTKEDNSMDTVTDVAKAAAVAVVKRFDGIVDGVAKRHQISRSAALLKVAADSEMAADWFAYRQASQVIGSPPAPTPEPEPVAVSDAYTKMMRKAEKRAARNGTRVATEFSKLYAERPDLAAQDRAFRLGGRAA